MKHLQRDLDNLQRDLLTMAGAVEDALHKALKACKRATSPWPGK